MGSQVPRDQVESAKEATPKKRGRLSGRSHCASWAPALVEGRPKEAKPKPKSPKLKEKAEKVTKAEKPKAKAKSKGPVLGALQ